MKIGLLVGAAYAAAMVLAVPVPAATSPGGAVVARAPVDQAVADFYAARRGSPLWLRSGADSAAARELIGALQRAQLDGLAGGPVLAARAQALIARAEEGDASALASADRLLSTAWVLYVQALQVPPAGMTYADPWVTPRRHPPAQILAAAAAAPSLAAYVRTVSAVNPLYAQLRDAAWTEMQAGGGQLDLRVLTSLDRARDMPFQRRYIMVDAGAARLYMIENGRIVDSMKVIVGTADDPTPMLASTIYYATLNPYWHVSGELIRSLIAPNVLGQGLGYLKRQGYQIQSADSVGDSAPLIDPRTVDWRAVADGREAIRVRQLPGPANSMGRLKFGFPNATDIFLHDTPVKEKFYEADRTLSHGCIRLEDAERLGRWMMGRDPQAPSNAPEVNIALPMPVPIYVTYLTAQPKDGRLGFVDDLYGLDARRISPVAALR